MIVFDKIYSLFLRCPFEFADTRWHFIIPFFEDRSALVSHIECLEGESSKEVGIEVVEVIESHQKLSIIIIFRICIWTTLPQSLRFLLLILIVNIDIFLILFQLHVLWIVVKRRVGPI